jgi:hypothetical protein
LGNLLVLFSQHRLPNRVKSTAQAIEALFGSQLENHLSELAHHYSRSGNAPKAVEYLQRAGEQAIERLANAEAIAQLTAALDLLKGLPDAPARARREIGLQLSLGGAIGVGIRPIRKSSALCRGRGNCPPKSTTTPCFSTR